MSDTIYRPYEPHDTEGVLAIILDAFHVRRYAPRPYLERSAAEVVLSDCLLASTYTRVAVDDVGRVLGVIMGRVEDEPHLPARPLAHARKLSAMAWLATAGLPQWHTLKQAYGFERRYAELRSDVLSTGAAALTDEITLFATHAAARGRGVGTHLYDGFMEHLRDHSRTDFFLYTDSLCNYQFYERRGMMRAATRDLELDVEGLPRRVGVYLYAGAVPGRH
ncbi:GNAT family N-acetyltransferase [Actinomyces sp. MRS3W]|uniref:GNAT family N-acetyltransferase n=1 Tax=Actinomyces sp. MRS3W TaxID=2800796 RepID=UPI0028FD261E|nr:GNAT family N-acetyltransferase [Actinomyces sp. MRS3W]MDU0349671.1 GNAT family N-acetyltransferase [Actinomyces sp. MRS3W]